MQKGNIMKIVKITETEHSKLNPRLKFFLRKVDEMGVCFRFKLADILKEKNLTVRECAKLTGLRLATISDMMNGNKSSINLHHILVIMVCLRITDINDIVEIYIPEEIKKRFENESKQWIEENELSDDLKLLIPYWEGAFDSKLNPAPLNEKLKEEIEERVGLVKEKEGSN